MYHKHTSTWTNTTHTILKWMSINSFASMHKYFLILLYMYTCTVHVCVLKIVCIYVRDIIYKCGNVTHTDQECTIPGWSWTMAVFLPQSLSAEIPGWSYQAQQCCIYQYNIHCYLANLILFSWYQLYIIFRIFLISLSSVLLTSLVTSNNSTISVTLFLETKTWLVKRNGTWINSI